MLNTFRRSIRLPFGYQQQQQNILIRLCSSISSEVGGHHRKHEEVDILVVGGGMVGNAFACAAGCSSELSGQKIVVLEAAPLKVKAESDDQKIIKLGVWQKLVDRKKTNRVNQLQVWDSCSHSRIEYGGDPVSWMVENDQIIGALTDTIVSECRNVHMKYDARVQNLRLAEKYNGHNEVDLENGETISAKLLIGADGASSSVRSTMGSRWCFYDYRQKGIVATLRLAQAEENHIAWQRFTPDGPVALLPLGPNLSSLVWTVPEDRAGPLVSASPKEFIEELNTALLSDQDQNKWANAPLFAVKKLADDWILPNYPKSRQPVPLVVGVEDGSRASFPFALGHSVRYIAQNVALIGDAAHRVHPLGGMGVNLGFGDVSVLIEELETAIRNGGQIGSNMSLENYERRRYMDNVPVITACDALNRLFSCSFAPAVALRGLGISAVNRCDPLKNVIMQMASR